MGARLLVGALCFHAGLWYGKEDMLVRSAWAAAQGFQGRTFVYASRIALSFSGVPEVFDCSGWGEFIANGKPVLPSYKTNG